MRSRAPERRVGREREQHRELDEDALHDRQARLRRRHRHVDVHAEDELAPGDVLEHLDERPVPVAGGDLLVLVERERMRAGGGEAHPQRPGVLGDVGPDVAQVGLGGRHVLAHDRPRFEDALHELGLQPVGELALGRLLEQGLDTGHEVEALRVDEHVLLFDAHGERWPRAEAVIEDAGARPPLAPSGGVQHGAVFVPHFEALANAGSTMGAGRSGGTVDARDSKSRGREAVWVRLPPSALPGR